MVQTPSKEFEINLKKQLKKFISAQKEEALQNKKQSTKGSLGLIKNYPDHPENFRLIQQYGNELYAYSQYIDKYDLLQKYLTKHNLSNQIRTKMIDWMIEIFNSYASEPKSFFLAVHILDSFITKTTKILCDEDIHLIGMCSIYIASKMEDIIPLHLFHIKTKIGHDKFSAKQIQKKEKEILLALDFDIIVVTTYDFIKTYLYDFYVNNKEHIGHFNLEKHLVYIENTCLFLSRLIALSDAFSLYKYSLKAICCIAVGFDIVRTNSQSMTKKMENFMRQWILFLLKQSQFNSQKITVVYNKLVNYYQDMDSITSIAPSITYYTNFNFN